MDELLSVADYSDPTALQMGMLLGILGLVILAYRFLRIREPS